MSEPRAGRGASEIGGVAGFGRAHPMFTRARYRVGMATRVLITIDTELTWRHYTPGESWHDNFARSYDPAGVGVPWQLEMLAAHELKACFFVDPMPALVYGLDPVRAMVEPILSAGQEVQLHLHPFWDSLASGEEQEAFELGDLPAARQKRLIKIARDLLVDAGAPSPIAFRAGSFSADAATLTGLRAIGIRYDSSYNGSHHPWPSALPLDPRCIAPVALNGLVELPVTHIEQSAGSLRHLQLCAVSSAEIEAALLHATAHRHPVVTLVSHSFELATRDGLRRNGTVCRRFERLCRFMAERRDSLPTAHFVDFDDVPCGVEAAPLPPRPVRRIGRVAQQFWSDARYERPATAMTALGGTTTSGAEILAPLLGL
jgi:hypothetical protein